MDQKTNPSICFICGVRRRSGTNFLYQLLFKHPRCAHPGEVEDYILHHSHLLEAFADRAYLVWNDDLQPEGNKEKADVLRAIGRALESILVEQSKRYGSITGAKQIIVTKTPSAVGVERIPHMFPTSRVIILVRDGRAVVESAKKTWGWGVDFDSEASAWASNVRAILDLPTANGTAWWLMVRYEDLVANTENELRRIFRFLGLPENEYNFSHIQSQEVIGSSQFRTNTTQAAAVRLQNPPDFAPLERFKHWNQWRQWRFAWIAGAELQKLGYEVPDTAKGIRYAMYNLILDALGVVLQPLRIGLLALRRHTGIGKRGSRFMAPSES